MLKLCTEEDAKLLKTDYKLSSWKYKMPKGKNLKYKIVKKH